MREEARQTSKEGGEGEERAQEKKRKQGGDSETRRSGSCDTGPVAYKPSTHL